MPDPAAPVACSCPPGYECVFPPGTCPRKAVPVADADVEWPERIWVEYVGGSVDESEWYDVTGWVLDGEVGGHADPGGAEYVPAAEIARLRAENERYQAMVLRATEAIETIGRREEALRAEVAPVCCPCCEGYRDRGDGTHDHCGVCDDEDEVSPAKAAEYQIGIRDTELEYLRAEVAELRSSIAHVVTLVDEIGAEDDDGLCGIKHHCYGALIAVEGPP